MAVEASHGGTSVWATRRQLPHKTRRANTSVICQSNELDRLFSFPDPTYRRATTASKVLQCCGQLFSSSHGSEALFEETSRPVDRIGSFLSHNWKSGRWRKFLALSLHFNLGWGFAAAFAVSMASMACEDRLGTLSFMHYGSTPAMLLMVLFGRELLACIGLSGPTCFLDKCCIHQADAEVQRQGIEKLGAYMRYSDEVVVCFTEMYLKRLWTVYELATYLTINGTAKMSILPLDLPVYSVSLWLLLWLITAGFNAVSHAMGLAKASVGSPLWLGSFAAACFLGQVALVVVMRRWARTLAAAHDVVRAFDLRTAACAMEVDRKYVERSIIQLMRHIDQPRGWLVDREVLMDEFNAFVREQVPLAIESSAGRFGMPTGMVLGIAVPLTTLTWELTRSSSYRAGVPLLLPLDAVKTVVQTCVNALVLKVLCWRCLGLRGYAEMAYLVGVMLLATATCVLLFVGEASMISVLATGWDIRETAWFEWTRAAVLLGAVAWMQCRSERVETPKLTAECARDRI